MEVSVIIPVYNRENILKKCIDHLLNQTYSHSEYEIIIVDDGSAEEKSTKIKKMAQQSPGVLRYYRQEHRGPASARNFGIKVAEGRILLMLGADIISTETLIAEHAAWHREYAGENIAVLGQIKWSPSIKMTPFLRWLEYGPQFGYPLIKDFKEVPYNFFYSSNISLKKQFLIDNGLFDEDFPFASYEDIELGYRLLKKGLRIVYSDKAVAYHEHHIDKKSFRKRSEIVAVSLKIFHEKHPECAVKKAPMPLSLFKTVIGYLAWIFPEAAAKYMPERLLHIGYGCMIEYFAGKKSRPQ